MARLFRLWGKKKGHRLTGWWLVGSVGEAFFFGSLFILGIFALAIVVAWQVFSPQTNIYPIGFGFWLMVLAMASIAGIGGVGFLYRILTVATSNEHRHALSKQAQAIGKRSDFNRSPPTVPRLGNLMDSPGVHLAFRLPSRRPDTHPLILRGLFALAWNGLIAVLIVFCVQSLLDARPEWLLIVLLFPFCILGFFAARNFLIHLRHSSRIGGTTVEVSALPLVAGQSYQLYFAQYGRVSLRKLSIKLVCEETATYHQGTDLRVESVVVHETLIREATKCRADYDSPIELHCHFQLPPDLMHSFQSDHNAIHWKILVEGVPARWPSYYRSFPVIVFPRTSNSDGSRAVS